MVSGFLISPYDQDRIFSGDAIEIRIWSKTCAGVVGLNRFIISWFMVFSVCQLSPAEFSSQSCPAKAGHPAITAAGYWIVRRSLSSGRLLAGPVGGR